MPMASARRPSTKCTAPTSSTTKGLPPARGQKYVLPGGAFFDIRGGKISRVSNYYNLQDWIDQVSA